MIEKWKKSKLFCQYFTISETFFVTLRQKVEMGSPTEAS